MLLSSSKFSCLDVAVGPFVCSGCRGGKEEKPNPNQKGMWIRKAHSVFHYRQEYCLPIGLDQARPLGPSDHPLCNLPV
jgi:hypothetical protein